MSSAMTSQQKDEEMTNLSPTTNPTTTSTASAPTSQPPEGSGTAAATATTTPSSNPSSHKNRANSSFFASLLKTGHVVDVYSEKNKQFKSFLFQFSPEASALISVSGPGSTTYTNYISLRKFAITFNPNSPLVVILKTPNKTFTLRFRDIQLRTLMVNWLNTIQQDSSILAQNSLLLSTTANTPGAEPKWHVPGFAATFCGCCHEAFSSLSKKNVCSDCGYRYCSKSQCYTTTSSRCNFCLQNHGVVTYEGKSTGKDAVVPVFNETQSLAARNYFTDVVAEDPFVAQQQQFQQLQQQRLQSLGSFGPLGNQQQTNYLTTTNNSNLSTNNNTITIHDSATSSADVVPTPTNSTSNNNNNNNNNTPENHLFERNEQRRSAYFKKSVNVYGDYLLAVFVAVLLLLPFLKIYNNE